MNSDFREKQTDISRLRPLSSWLPGALLSGSSTHIRSQAAGGLITHLLYFMTQNRVPIFSLPFRESPHKVFDGCKFCLLDCSLFLPRCDVFYGSNRNLSTVFELCRTGLNFLHFIGSLRWFPLIWLVIFLYNHLDNVNNPVQPLGGKNQLGRFVFPTL